MIGVIEYKEMKNRDVGSQAKGKAGNQARTIWKAGGQCRLRGYNSTSGVALLLTTLLSALGLLRSVLYNRYSAISPLRSVLSDQSSAISPLRLVLCERSSAIDPQ